MFIALFLLGLALGFTLAWFMGKGQTRLRVTEAVTQLETKAGVEAAKAAGFESQLRGLETDLREVEQLLAAERESKAVALTRLEESSKNIDEQKKILESAQEKFKTTFEALSGEALKSNNQAFLDLAKKSLDGVLQGTKGEIAEKTNEIKSIVGPLEEILKRYDEQVRELEKNRATAYGSLENQIQSLIGTQQLLQKETGSLVSALRTPHIRGQWGQISLKRVVELAGMTEYCDYQEQVSVKVEESRLQPDMIVKLPNQKQVVLDSKVSLHAYMDYIEAADEASRKAALIRHSQQIRKHMNDLSSKSYWSQFPQAPEFVVMFIPGEPFVSAAVENDPSLIEDGVLNRVIIATPTTLISLLRAIAYGWRQEQVTKNTQVIAELGKQLYERFGTFLGHLAKTRNSLEQSIFNFNRTVSSFEGRVMPSLRKFKELGTTGAEDLPSIEPIEQTPRQVEGYEGKESDPVKDLFTAKK